MLRELPPPPSNGVQCYEYHPLEERPAERPLNVLFVTSIRDVGREDRNGSVIDTPQGKVKMPGLIETVTHMINEKSGDLGRWMRTVGIVTDDDPRDNLDGYPGTPIPGRPWIHDLDLRNDRGELLSSLTVNIPSHFRKIPGNRFPEEKAEAKADFENEVHRMMDESGADIIVSDHLIMRIDNLIRDAHGQFGRILNIHPAVTRGDYPMKLRGLTPTRDAIDRANGFRRVNGHGEQVAVTPHSRTGATLHLVDETIDAGAVIADSEPTIVHGDDDPQVLRHRNYLAAKIPVFVAGIRHYVENLFPYLDELDLRNAPPPSGAEVIPFPILSFRENGIPVRLPQRSHRSIPALQGSAQRASLSF